MSNDIATLAHIIVIGVLNDPNMHEITCLPDTTHIKITIAVPPDKMPILIGKNGDMVKHMVAILNGCAKHIGKKVSLEIISLDGQYEHSPIR
jgi:predicted RNA-binding protein YlqC (UPF0109 family)